MKNTKRVLTLAMAIVMLMTMVISASALVGNPAGPYGRIYGMQTWVNNEDVRTITNVTTNSGDGTLYVTVDVLTVEGNSRGEKIASSARGAQRLEAFHYYEPCGGNEVISCAWIAHEVRGQDSYVYRVVMSSNGQIQVV